MTVPAFRTKGAFTSGTGSIVVPEPVTKWTGDLLLLVVNTANQPIAAPSGWTQVANSPQGTGTGGSARATSIQAFWRIAGPYLYDVTLPDAGSYIAGQMFAFGGVDSTTPINVTAGSVQATAATAWTFPVATTTRADCLILNVVGMDRDANSDNTLLSSWANANLSSGAEITDATSGSGTGGGVGMFAGGLASSGSSGATTVTSAESTTAAFLTIGLAPIGTFSAEITESSAVAASQEGYKNVTTASQEETIGTGDEVEGRIPVLADIEETAGPADASLTIAPIEYLGSVTLNVATRSGSQTITVPAGTDCAVLFFIFGVAQYTEGLDSGAFTADIGGVSFTWRAKSSSLTFYVNCGNLTALTAAFPPTGDQTFTWELSSLVNVYTGYYLGISFYKNVSVDNPVIASGSAGNNTENLNTVTVSGLAWGGAAMLVGAAAGYTDGSPTATGQTAIAEDIGPPAYSSGTYYYNSFYKPCVDGSATASGSMLTAPETVLLCLTLRPRTGNDLADSASDSAAISEESIGLAGGNYQEAAEDTAAVSDASTGIEVSVTSETTVVHHHSGQFATMLGDEPIVIYPTVISDDDYTVTIPAGTQAIVAFYYCGALSAGYCDADDYSFSLDGWPFTHVVDNNYTLACAKLISPPTGELPFAWSITPGNTHYDDTHITLVCLGNVDTSTDPIVDFGAVANLYDASISGLSFDNEADILVGMVKSYPDDDSLYAGGDAIFPLMPRKVQQKLEPPIQRVYYNPSRVAVNWGVTTFEGYSTEYTTSSAIAVVVRGLDLGSIVQGGNDRATAESAVVSAAQWSPSSYDAAATEGPTIRAILGPYVDIPERLLLSEPLPRPNHLASHREDPYNEFYMYPNADTSLIVVAYVTSRSEATWHYEGNYTLTLNGVAFTHLYNTVGQANNMMVAYLKNPTPGMLISNFPNPHLPRAEDDWTEPTDMWMMAQFIGVDILGDPIRSSAYVFDSDPAGANAVTGLTFDEGDLTMAIGAGNFTGYPAIGDRHIVSASAYHVSMGWYMGISAGGIPAGASSISGSTENAEVPESRINLFGMVLKLDPNLYEAFVQAAEESESVTPTDAFTGAQIYGGNEVEAGEVLDQNASNIAVNASHSSTSEVYAVASYWLLGEIACEDTLQVTAAQTASGDMNASGGETLVISGTQTALAAMFGTATETAGGEDAVGGDRVTYAIAGEVKTAEDGVNAIILYGGTANEVTFIYDSSSAQADMYATVLEMPAIRDQWLAELIERFRVTFLLGQRFSEFWDTLSETQKLADTKITIRFSRVAVEPKEFVGKRVDMEFYCPLDKADKEVRKIPGFLAPYNEVE